MQRFLTLMLLLAASTISLTGCGNKAPLFLPPPVQEISAPAEVAEEVSEEVPKEAPAEVSEETVESEDSSDTPEDSPENTEAAAEPETTEAD